MTDRPDDWFVRLNAPDSASIDLVCFPHAGGGPTAFWCFSEQDPGDMTLYAVCLPGHEHRLDEPPIGSLDDLANHLADLCVAKGFGTARPFVFFGHSFGGLLAYEVVRVLQSRSSKLPTLLAVSSHRSPDRDISYRRMHDLPSDAFWAALKDLGGIPGRIADSPRLRARLEPGIRADITCVETKRPRAIEVLPCAISMFRGKDDPVASTDEMSGWRAFGAIGGTLRAFAGDHFYIPPNAAAILAAIRHDCGMSAPPLAITGA